MARPRKQNRSAPVTSGYWHPVVQIDDVMKIVTGDKRRSAVAGVFADSFRSHKRYLHPNDFAQIKDDTVRGMVAAIYDQLVDPYAEG